RGRRELGSARTRTHRARHRARSDPRARGQDFGHRRHHIAAQAQALRAYVKTGLRGRFALAGILLVATTAASSAWSGLAFRRVSLVVDAVVKDSERTTGATGTLAGALEREDDALLLTLADEPRGRYELANNRTTVGAALDRVDELLTSPSERATAAVLRRKVDAYHVAGDRLVMSAHEAG